MMEITHIFHSGFAVELDHAILIFDWYTGKLPVFSREKPVYCFVSHSHGDHYGSCIWGLREQFREVTYILDRNVRVPGAGLRVRAHLPHADIVKVRPHQTCRAGAVEIETLLSTDQGVAFLLRTEGKTIFHAGDLNIWYWEGEPDKENKWQIGTFKKEMERLRNCEIDVAFVPVDPRLEAHGADGAACFLQMTKCRMLVPMHYWERRKEAAAYLNDPRLAPYRDIIYMADEMSAFGVPD